MIVPPDISQQPSELDVAIIGMAGRFPGAANIDEFWENLKNGKESIAFFSDRELLDAGVDEAFLSDPDYVKAAPILEDSDKFDADLFGYSPKEACIMDPQQRVFLECAWEALETSGYGAGAEFPVGVFAGAAMNTYLLSSGLLEHFFKEYLITVINNDKDYLATRVSYKLNLTGPSVSVQTACSSSLVAVHMACQSLLNEECDMALAGGVSVRVPQTTGYFYREGSVFSPDGHCRTFDAKARGTIFGSGVGIVVVRRLVDAIEAGDSVHAVIKGTAINNDGSAKVEFTAPSVGSQSEAIVEAISNAEIDARTVSYVEAHGTGTLLGDPIEVTALTKAFRAFTADKQFCAIGSAKTNVGHMDAAAGVAGLLKVVLSLKNSQIPPILHFEKPNPEIDLPNSPFYVNTQLSDWKTGPYPRRAAVNALGMGGTNAHVVVQEAPRTPGSSATREWQLLLLSARTKDALETLCQKLTLFIEANPEINLADAAFTLQVGRKVQRHRRSLVCRTHGEAVRILRTGEAPEVRTKRQDPVDRCLAFMFTGQGAQHPGMGRALYSSEPVFRRRIDRCSEFLEASLGIDLRKLLFPSEGRSEAAAEKLDRTIFTQPALFAIEYALAELWMSWGIQPQALIGHSIGEYVAATLAGIFTLDEALGIVSARGRLMQKLPPGAMLSISSSESDAGSLISRHPGLSVAAVNSPTHCVVAGETDKIDALQKKLNQQKISCRRLRASHAFHSAAMDPILDEFADIVAEVGPREPKIPIVSNLTGEWLRADEAVDPRYWSDHLRRTVRFADGIGELLREPNRVLLEVGPGMTLRMLAEFHPERSPQQPAYSSLPAPTDDRTASAHILQALGDLWMAGVKVDWDGFYARERRHRIPLPNYPFQRKRYWIESADTVRQERPGPMPSGGEVAAAGSEAGSGVEALERGAIEERLAEIWQRVLGVPTVGIHEDFFEMGGNSILITQTIYEVNRVFKAELSTLTLWESPTIAGLAESIETVIRMEHLDSMESNNNNDNNN